MELFLNILENENIKLFVLFFLFFLLGWVIRNIYKLFIFFFLKFFGRFGERKARKLLSKNGYEIIKEQFTVKGKLLENNNKRSFFIKPDFLVKKKNIVYIAEVKTGKSASIGNRFTRRQLLEYATIYNSNKILLVDVEKNSISLIEFYNLHK